MIRPFQSASRSIVMVALLLLAQSAVHAQRATFENEPVNYQQAEVHNDVSLLIARMQSGDFELEFERPHGYLKSLLKGLKIPVNSQALVFSKTSLQLQKISPRRPRAIYFNDNVYVGYVQSGGTIEIGATDPKQGAIFYALKQEKSKGVPSYVTRGNARFTTRPAVLRMYLDTWYEAYSPAALGIQILAVALTQRIKPACSKSGGAGGM